MATASLSTTPECSICFNIIKIPKFLPCGHTFCLRCIEEHIGSIEKHIGAKIKIFPCPLCKQDVNIPEGGAKEFPTNFILMEIMMSNKEPEPSTTKQLKCNQQREEPKCNQQKEQLEPSSTKQPKCPNHNQREVDYYCNKCNVGLCFKCILGQHKEHETLDLECDETRNKAIEKLQHSQKIIQNRINNLKKTRFTLLKSFEELKTLCEDSCAKVGEKTEQIVSDLRKRCEQIKNDFTRNLEENRSRVERREMEITSDIYELESNMESNIPPSAKTTLNILQTLPGLIEIEKQGESEKDYTLRLQYLQWVGKGFTFGLDQLGTVICKESFFIPGSYQFLFDPSDIKEEHTNYYSKSKFRNNNLVWSCVVKRESDEGIYIGIKPLSVDNPKLNYCVIDYQISLFSIDDDSRALTGLVRNRKFDADGMFRGLIYPITWSKFTDKNNGYINSNGQFVVQFNITQIKDISGVDNLQISPEYFT